MSEEKKQIESHQHDQVLSWFRTRCVAQRIPYNSKAYFTEQASFFAGAIATLEALGYDYPPVWGIFCMSDRPLIKEYKF